METPAAARQARIPKVRQLLGISGHYFCSNEEGAQGCVETPLEDDRAHSPP